jgi:hypothetical protein
VHIHLPKPLHGWRELIGEVAVIVIGILIALGGEQAVEALHHRAEVKEGSQKLRRQSLENREAMIFSLTGLEEAIAAAGRQLASLGDCDVPINAERLARVQPLRFLSAGNAGWQGIRDSALLQRMPEAIVENYWKMEAASVSIGVNVVQLDEARTRADAAVDAVRQTGADQQACEAARIELLRLRSAERTLWRQAAFYHFSNEQVLRGEHLTTVNATAAARQVDNAERVRLPQP